MRTKILLSFSNLILIALLITGCDQDGNNTQNSVTDQPCSISASASISPNTAQMLAQNYYNSLPELLKKKGDALSVWYSLEEIEKFICAIRSGLSQDKCTDSLKNLGIRFYFGRYPSTDEMSTMSNNGELSSVNLLYADHHTLFLIPTYEEKGINIDFDPGRGIEAGQCNPTPMKKLVLDNDKNYAQTISGSILGPYANTNSNRFIERNHGQLIPPEDARGAFFIQRSNAQ